MSSISALRMNTEYILTHTMTNLIGVVGFMQSVPITTNVVRPNPVHGEVYSMQHYVIKFVIDFLRVLRFPPPVKLTSTI